MAQTDSQRSDSEDPESLNSPTDLPKSQIDGSAVEKGPLSEDESFQSSVGEMLDSIDTDSSEGEISGGGNGDATGAESEHPSRPAPRISDRSPAGSRARTPARC